MTVLNTQSAPLLIIFPTYEIFEENVYDIFNLLITSWLLPHIIKLLWQWLMPQTILNYQQCLVDECELSGLEMTSCRCLFSDKEGLLTQGSDNKHEIPQAQVWRRRKAAPQALCAANTVGTAVPHGWSNLATCVPHCLLMRQMWKSKSTWDFSLAVF